MSEVKLSGSASQLSHEEIDVEKHDEIHIPGLHVHHVHKIGGEIKDAEVKEARNAAFAAAVAAGSTNPLSKAAFVIYTCAAAAFMCSCGNGYDGSLMTAINGMTPYQNRFNQGHLNVSTGIIFSIYTIGQMAGSLFAGQICDRFGRRAGMFVGCLTIMAGSAIISSSMERGQFIAGRFILGMGIAVATIGAPTYTVEIAPPHWRGRLTSLYNTGWNGGAIPAAAITLGTSNITSDWSWRIPLILQAFPATLVVLTVWFLPESPRWYYMHGQEEKAFEFLRKYHGNGDINNPIVLLEIEEFKNNIQLNGSDKRWWDFKALIKNHNARWRMLMVFLMGFFGQMSGNGLGYFNLSIYQALGFDKQMQFNMNLIGTCCNALVAWVAVSLEDRMPRRKVLVWGTLGCSLMLAANAGFSAAWANYEEGHQNLDVGRAGAAFFFLFGVVYAFTYTPLQSLYPAECLENTTRAKGVSVKIFIISCTSFINLFCTPIAYGRIGWKYILVFVFWDAFETVIWYFFCVETVGFTLEELDEIFSAPNPIKASTQKKKIVVKKTGDVFVVD
ncbi:general substrate transporter [Fomitiporia mediterranea MF3/22]|uniref:general substrate transporter n=1 Tax=Fomitiporia mediterranea (strain MF3/22) TaxID=694068 RepID=UPI0004408398|nr:general substrate transporter [Fomitiporia mediterranea MF3/22]EJD05087.1 general substrate transporter [Fomitiporia mediterranea MF3/22]